MKTSTKRYIQTLIVRTSIPPLNFIYALAYRFSIRLATLALGRIPGVLSIYLRRGAARGEIVYGLSDIDLLVVVKVGPQQGSQAGVKVRSVYAKLSRVSPLFGNIDQELGLYSLGEFTQLFQNSPFYRYRLDCGRTEWRLLHGQDIISTLPRLLPLQLKSAAVEEIKVWWPKLVELTLPAGPDNRIFSRYLWYKAISEVAKIYSVVCSGQRCSGRNEAILNLRTGIDACYQPLILEIEKYPLKLNSRGTLPVDDLFGLFIHITETICTRLIYDYRLETDRQSTIQLVLPKVGGLEKDHLVGVQLTNLKLEISNIMGTCTKVVHFPAVEFNIDILNNDEIDTFYFVVIANSRPTCQQISRLGLCFREQTARRFEPYIALENVALSLRSDHPETSVKNAAIDPIFFSLLKASTYDSDLKNHQHQSCALPAEEFRQILNTRLNSIKIALDDKDIYKLEALDFDRFFWATARTVLLHRDLEHNITELPLTSTQIYNKLDQSFPEEHYWLSKFYFEYNKALINDTNECYRYFSDCVSFLRRLTNQDKV